MIDAFTSNVDRTVRNTSLLLWHRQLWLIDPGASLYFRHSADWDAGIARPADDGSLERGRARTRRGSA